VFLRLGKGIAAAAAALLLCGCAEPPAPLRAGADFPPLALPRLDDNPAAEARPPGRPALVVFWATWCPPCREEMPSLQRLSDAFGADRLAVVGVSVDDDANLAREFLLRHGIRFPILLDADREQSRRLQVPGFPTAVLVDGDGRIAAVIVGGRDWATEASVAELERLLGVARGGSPADPA
jgi:thiol-disulfide isomerase/thioredoxin